jgi:hypothetical protein
MLDVPSFAFGRLDRRIGVFWDDVEETMRGHILLVATLLGSGCAPGSSGWVVSLEGRVVDAFNNGIQNAGVEVRSRSGGAELGAIQTDSAGYWRLPLYVESGQEGVSWPLAIEAEAPGLQAGVSYWDFSYWDDTWEAEPVSLGPGQEVVYGVQRTAPVVLFEALGSWSGLGRAVDVSTGFPVPLASVRLRAGWNASLEDPVLLEAKADEDGLFGITVDQPGLYTVEVVAPFGFNRSRAPFRLGPNTPSEQLVFLSPQAGSQELRAALVWLDAEVDLELHLSGPKSQEQGRFQVHREAPSYSESGGLVAQMEQRVSGGESVVLYSAEDGAYRLSAYDPEHALEASSQALGQSMATMILWSEQGSFMESVNPGIPANLWHALDYHPKSEEVLRLQQLRTGVESREEILLDGG